MKIGIMNTLHSYSGIHTEDSLQHCTDLGFRYIDLMTISDLHPRYLNHEKIVYLDKTFNHFTVVPSCLIANVGGNGASSDEDLRNRTAQSVMRIIEVATQLGFPMVLFFAGEKEKGISPQKQWSYMKLFLEQCLVIAEKNRTILTFESNPRIFRMINSTDEMLQLIQEFPSPYLKATVDIGHMNIIREHPSEITKLQGHIIHAHITDNDGTADTNETLGTGLTPIPECLRALVSAEFEETALQMSVEPVAVIELGSPEKPNLKSMDRVLKRSMEYLQRVASQYFQNIEQLKCS